MSATKLRDLAVKVREYQDRQTGKPKSVWRNVGSLMKGDDGEFIILNRDFNPAGVPNPDHRDTVLISCFKLKAQDGDGAEPSAQPRRSNGGFDAKSQRSAALPEPMIDDDIPF